MIGPPRAGSQNDLRQPSPPADRAVASPPSPPSFLLVFGSFLEGGNRSAQRETLSTIQGLEEIIVGIDGEEEEIGCEETGRGRSDIVLELLQRRELTFADLHAGHEPAETRLSCRRAPRAVDFSFPVRPLQAGGYGFDAGTDRLLNFLFSADSKLRQQEKLYQWIMRQLEHGSRITASDIVLYLQNEIDCGGDDTFQSPRRQHVDCHPQSTLPFSTSNTQTTGLLASSAAVLAPRQPSHNDQSKNSVFSSALSSPIRRSLQPYHLAQGEEYYTAGGTVPLPATISRSREAESHDSSMEMHSESPAHDSY
ncbi:hypothetical protein AXF42_Ash011297 [Apostasia shenzhenica]|uniref:Uncharacterized protein n=1 Tax=Apostasia shenzhenica TaxID=1088818 RepID=A0A2I0AE50_9ASPA|nr:hypothetical protein AXF42_Ash011297 [Apostasia shenzhenica]